MEGGRINHSWCMCIVGHGYGGLGEGRDESGGLCACVTKPGVGHMSGDAGALLQCEVIH